MAELWIPQENAIKYGCYSERGIMSYFVFRQLPTLLSQFLSHLTSLTGKALPFNEVSLNDQLSNVTLFGELEFGNRGFGSPDGAVYFELDQQAILMFIEVKFNETYQRSNNKPIDKYNSTLKGQLELKWRMMSSYFLGLIHEENCDYIVESDAQIASYGASDTKYKFQSEAPPGRKARRCLAMREGVGEFFARFVKSKITINDVYFVGITQDTENPFAENENLPQFIQQDGASDKSAYDRLCWVSSNNILSLCDIRK